MRYRNEEQKERCDGTREDRGLKRTTKTGISLISAASAAKAIQQAVIPLPHEAIVGLSKLTPLDVKTGVFERIIFLKKNNCENSFYSGHKRHISMYINVSTYMFVHVCTHYLGINFLPRHISHCGPIRF